MNTRRLLSLCACLVPMLSSLGVRAQAATSGTGNRGGFPLGGLLLVALVIGGLYLLLRRRRPPENLPPPPNPYARDDAFGRGPGAEYPAAGPGAYPGGPYAGGPAQDGMGSSLARGLGTGLAVGAGVVVAQEIGRRMSEHGREGVPQDPQRAGPADHAANTQSPLARDAGAGSLDGSGRQDFAHDPGGQEFGIADGGDWDDAAGPGFDDVGGGDDWGR